MRAAHIVWPCEQGPVRNAGRPLARRSSARSERPEPRRQHPTRPRARTRPGACAAPLRPRPPPPPSPRRTSNAWTRLPAAKPPALPGSPPPDFAAGESPERESLRGRREGGGRAAAAAAGGGGGGAERGKARGARRRAFAFQPQRFGALGRAEAAEGRRPTEQKAGPEGVPNPDARACGARAAAACQKRRAPLFPLSSGGQLGAWGGEFELSGGRHSLERARVAASCGLDCVGEGLAFGAEGARWSCVTHTRRYKTHRYNFQATLQAIPRHKFAFLYAMRGD
jgi:hypothetical protein